MSSSYLIAEMACSHEGDVKIAKELLMLQEKQMPVQYNFKFGNYLLLILLTTQTTKCVVLSNSGIKIGNCYIIILEITFLIWILLLVFMRKSHSPFANI